ncbi:MAG: amidohydrolase family protein [Pseudomonadota bacterium]
MAAPPGTLLEALQEAGTADRSRLQPVLAAMTANPARALGLERKGHVAPGADADVLLIHPESLQLIHVMGRGRWLLRDSEICQ